MFPRGKKFVRDLKIKNVKKKKKLVNVREAI